MTHICAVEYAVLSEGRDHSLAMSKFMERIATNYAALHSQVVCETTLCADANVRKAAYEAIWTIATLYYDRLQVNAVLDAHATFLLLYCFV